MIQLNKNSHRSAENWKHARRGFVSSMAGSLALLAIITVIWLEWSATSQQQVVTASLLARKVSETQSDAITYLNAVQINAEVATAYRDCGCNSTGVWNNTELVNTGQTLFTSLRNMTPDGSKVYLESINVNGGSCSGGISSQFTYQVNTTSGAGDSVASKDITANQTDAINLYYPANGINMTILRGGKSASTVLVCCNDTLGAYFNGSNLNSSAYPGYDINKSTENFDRTNLTGWWDLGDSAWNEAVTGSSLDLSGNGNTLYYQGSIVERYPCPIGKCISFYGCKSYGILPIQTGGFPFTLAFWLNTTGNGAGTITGVETQCASSCDKSDDFGIGVNGGNLTLWANTTRIQTNQTVNNGWHFVVVTYTPGIGNSGTIALYDNGASITTLIANLTNNSNYYLGASYVRHVFVNPPSTTYGASNFLNNTTFDDVKFWKEVVTNQMISGLYNNGNPTGNNGLESSAVINCH